MSPNLTPNLTPDYTIHLKNVIVRPLYMSKSEFTQTVHRASLDMASDEIMRLTDDLTVVDNLGLVGAVELLMRLGVLFSALNVPEINNE